MRKYETKNSLEGELQKLKRLKNLRLTTWDDEKRIFDIKRKLALMEFDEC